MAITGNGSPTGMILAIMRFRQLKIHRAQLLGLPALTVVAQLISSHHMYAPRLAEMVCSTHYIGNAAIELFAEAFGENYIPVGTGTVNTLP
jgi:metal-dependent hydrolase (beta-lactamase superfamily II)